MNPERSWIVLLLLLGLGVPAATWLTVPGAGQYALLGGEKAAPPRAMSARTDASAGKDKKKAKKKDSGDDEKENPDAELTALFERAEQQASFLFATLPDPRENLSPRGFDEQFGALRRALETAGYSKFDSWDPWFGGADDQIAQKLWRTLPGLTFFRRENDRPLGIFIIGETPTRGIHEQALQKALDLWGRESKTKDGKTVRPQANETLRILGPSSSGAARSLADALATWKKREDNNWFKGTIRAVTGSATSESNAALMRAQGIEFDATVHDDRTLGAFVSDYLEKQLGIGAGEIAILAESSSAYGQHVATSNESDKASGKSLVLRYPPYLRSVRQSYARVRASKPVAPGSSSALEIDAEDDLAAGLFDPHAAPSRAMAELSLNRVIEAIAAERIRAVEIAALDPQDAAFLASRVKESFPTVTVVILSSDVLYLHHDYEIIDGLLVASTYPLSNRSQRTTYPFNGVNARHSFPSEQAEGTFNAALVLIGAPNLMVDYGPPLRVQSNGQTPALWMSVVSNGEIWPVHVRTRDDLERMAGLAPRDAKESYVHVETPSTVKAVPEDAWKASRGVGFYSFVSLFSILSLICIGCYVWARTLGNKVRDAAAPLLVRVLGNLPYHPHEASRRSFMTVLLLVLGVLWSFVAVVQAGAVHRPTESLTAAPLIRTAGYLVTATQLLVMATLVYSALRIPAWSDLHKWLEDKNSKAVFYKWLKLADRLPDYGRGLRLLVSAVAAVAIVLVTERSLDGWFNRCGFSHGLVGPADDPRCQQFVLFLDRARALNGGVSLIATLFVLAVGYFVWYGAHLFKAWHADGFRPLRKRPLFTNDAPSHLAPIKKTAETAYTRFESVTPSLGIGIPMIGFLAIAYVRASQLPFFEKLSYLKGVAAVYALFLMLLVYGCGRSLELWWHFRALLQKIATLPRMQSAGEGTNDLLIYLGGPWSRKVAQAWRNVAADLSPDVHAAVAGAVAANGKIDTEKWQTLLHREEQGISKPASPEEADNWAKIRALRLWAIVNYLRQHLLNVLRATSVGLLLLLVVVSMYPFKGERLLLGMVLGLGVITSATVFLIFLRLDRDYVMACLRGNEKSDRSWNPTFIRGIVLHAGLPLLGILALRFPEVGGLLSSLSGPLAALLGK
jgi:hypothetical protein